MRDRHVKRVDRRMHTFNQQVIKDWNDEISTTNPAQIAQHQISIQEHRRACEDDQQHLQELISQQITPINTRITGLDSQIKVLTLPAEMNELEQQQNSCQNRINELLPQLQNIESVLAPINEEITRLSASIAVRQAQRQIYEWQQSITINTKDLEHHKEKLHELRHELSDLTSSCDSAKNQLSALEARQTVDSISHVVSGFDHHGGSGHHAHHGPHLATFHYANDVLMNAQISSLQSQIREYENKEHDLRHHIRQAEEKISLQENKIHEARRYIIDFQARIEDKMLSGRMYSYELMQLENLLTQKLAEKSPHEEVRNRLNTEIKLQQEETSALRTRISKLRSIYDQSLFSCYDFATERDLASLKMQLQKAQDERQQLDGPKKDLEAKIAAHHNVITTTSSAILALEHRQQTLGENQFLMRLRASPELLMNVLAEQVRAKITAFEKAHPAGQSENIRLCLADIEKKLQFMLSLPAESEDDFRQRYYQLCGMLWFMLDKADGDENLELAELMVAILRWNPVDTEDAKGAYQQLLSSYPENLRDMTLQELSVFESQEYDLASSNLDNTLNQIFDYAGKEFINLRKNGRDVLKSINDRKQELANDPHHFDLKYHTRILNKMEVLTRDPGNQQEQQEFQGLISHNKDGKPSLGKKIFGGVCMFLGAVGEAACVAAKVLTAGASSVVTIPGMAVSGALFLFGMGLFGWGTQRGIYKKLTKFEAAAEQVGKIQNEGPTEETPLRFGMVN